ncbi:MAG TPA: hypothetical protein PKJ03_06665 [Methanoregulaceae archaeon]|nr:hypothetical protein [Methanoregulaceae archaeon]
MADKYTNWYKFNFHKRDTVIKMSLLQDPIKVLDQIEWYLDHQDVEKFPGAFIRGAGNLSRQLLEQIIFILAFYSKLPQEKYIKTNKELRSIYTICNNLQNKNPTTGQTHLEAAHLCNPRIKKFARLSKSFNKWRSQFNEPSHYRNPITSPHTKETHIREFVRRLRQIIDPMDSHLITAAANELLSNGKLKAIIGDDALNTPGIIRDVIVSPRLFSVIDDKLTWREPGFKMQVIPADREIQQLKWRNQLILVQHTRNIRLAVRFITEFGEPVDMNNFENLLIAMGKTPEARKRLTRYFKKLGIVLEWSEIERS